MSGTVQITLTHEDLNKRGHKCILCVPLELAVQLLLPGWWHRLEIPGLPESAEPLSYFVDAEFFMVMFRHASFRRVPEGGVIPKIFVTKEMIAKRPIE